VFGSGRACRNSCDFRQPLRPARRKRPGLPARDSRRSPPGHPRLYRSHQAPAIAAVACSCRITAIAAVPPPHPPYITPSPQTPPFSHIIRTRRHLPNSPAPARGPVRPARAVQPSQLRPHRTNQAPHPSQPSRQTPTRANPSASQTQTERNPKFAANLFSQPVTPPPITVSCQPRHQARSVSRVFRVRCHIVTC
jgi:hypothetical protein